MHQPYWFNIGLPVIMHRLFIKHGRAKGGSLRGYHQAVGPSEETTTKVRHSSTHLLITSSRRASAYLDCQPMPWWLSSQPCLRWPGWAHSASCTHTTMAPELITMSAGHQLAVPMSIALVCTCAMKYCYWSTRWVGVGRSDCLCCVAGQRWPQFHKMMSSALPTICSWLLAQSTQGKP